MIAAVVWIASDEAKIFKFGAEGVESTHLCESGPLHHAETAGRNHPKKGGDSDRFLHHVADTMISLNAERWLVLGPGVAKTRFKHLVEKDFATIAKRIVSVIPMDKSTDGEIKDFAHDFFKKEGLYEPSMKLDGTERERH